MAQGYERSRYGNTHKCCLYQQPVTWIFTISRDRVIWTTKASLR